jgi:hypothetical protein
MSPLYFPSVTTISDKKSLSTWHTKLQEVVSLRIDTFGLFLTGLKPSERPELYEALLNIKEQFNFTIPFCHAVSSMTDEEFRFLSGEFGTQWFNLHPTRQYPLEHSLSREVRNTICIENAELTLGLTMSDCEDFAGICIDISHLEDARISLPENYEAIVRLTEQLPVRANHISGVSDKPQGCRMWKGEKVYHYSNHYSTAPHEFHYMHKLPQSAHAPIGAIELEIPIAQQLIIVDELYHRSSEGKLAA